MFWQQPADHEPTELEKDLATRMQPSAAVREIAMAMCRRARDLPLEEIHWMVAREPAVYVGLALPGKDRGIWTLGQPVEQVPGFFLAVTPEHHPAARTLAEEAAARRLAGRKGTSAYARIDAEGYCSVHEGSQYVAVDMPPVGTAAAQARTAARQSTDITGARCWTTEPHDGHPIIGSFRGSCPGIPEPPSRVLDPTEAWDQAWAEWERRRMVNAALRQLAQAGAELMRTLCVAHSIKGCEWCHPVSVVQLLAVSRVFGDRGEVSRFPADL